ncbi:MAG TPA: S8 family serine peptidase [Verrucomicrobiae bacterium]
MNLAAAESKILLRNKTIDTSGPKRLRAASANTVPTSGLYLIQLRADLPADWREQLSAQNVSIVRPVPQDAFVAEFKEANLSRIESLPFVHWVGPYLPEYKTHTKLQSLTEEAEDRRVRVTALLSPQADIRETALLQRRFARLTRYSKLPAGRVLEGEISSRKLQSLVDSKAVLWVEPAAEPKLFDALAAQIIGGEGIDNGIGVHDLGFDGEGVSVAVPDSGLHFGEADGMHVDLAGRVDAFFHYGELEDASDEHSHGTHVAGIIAGNGAGGETDEFGYLYGLGIAPKAHIVAQRMFDGLGGYHAPPSMAKLTTDAVRAGADIGSNSWGEDTQGRYDIFAMEFDALVRDADPETPGDQPFILEFSAGNAGPGERTIGSPAVAKNVIATGASQNERYDFLIYAGMDGMADFSSRGPCEDGRIKPDLAAPGTWIASLQSGAAGDENAWMGISPLYMYQGGTSQAGPQVSGAAAVFVQYYRETFNAQTPSPALVKAALINSATDMDNSLSPSEGGTSFIPNNDEGWGRVDLTELIGADRKFDFTDQTTLLRTGQTFEKRLVLASSEIPLKITLAYTDVPGFPPAIPALVNDLDLEVISPSGTVFRGNQFIDGESVPNAPAYDSINNVEGVHVEFPEAGEYVVRIIGRKVIEDARRDTAGVIDQDFALVFSGHVPFPGQGIVSLDRRAYTVPGQINIKLIDFDLAGQQTANVSLSSDSQTAGLPVSLRASGSIGVFTGAVQTATLPVASDGRLHFAHGDQILANYFDASRALTVTADAVGDFIAPIISNVSATNRFGKQLVTWLTDEPATSVVYYGTNITSPTAVTNTLFRTEHDATLENLVAGQTYRYFIVTTDRAGNRSTNNNNGAHFSFIARSAAPVLLVDAYTYTEDENREDVEIPVTEYTIALDRTGVAYEVWDTETEGNPQLDDLKPYRVVLWRVNDSFFEVANSLSTAQQTMISQYLASGGSFMMASMEILTRIGDTPFRTNVLQAARFMQKTDPFDECPDCDEDHGAFSAEGSELDSFTSGISVELDYTGYPIYEFGGIIPDIGPDVSDVFLPTTNAVPIFFEPDGNVIGIRSPKTGTDSSGRVVFLSFPLDAVPLDGPAPNNRANLLRNMLSFLAPGINGFGTLSLDNTTYTAPSQMTIEVADSDLTSASSVAIVVRNTTSGTQSTVQLQPTVRPGLFRGFITLVTNTPAGADRLSVADGDVVSAEYMDVSGSAVVRASADIDLGLPQISNVIVEPEYENALISWDTDELTDALVQFGESAFLGKTAYSAEMDIAHEVLLTSLLPDRVYYYRVVSRDTAGNTIIDDNNGQLYTFRTLKPFIAPWSDNMDTGGNDWSIQDGEDTERSWELGTPNNSLDVAAHSPPSAWGTNLRDEPIGYMFSNLISPAVELTGGNSATLSFWHNYDFTGDALLQYGRVLLFTNTQTQPIELAAYDEFSIGWEQEEFDLTPYIGRIVHIVFQYELFDFSLESMVFSGWMMDDVQIAITNIARGTLEITNNISAASFNVAGPTQIDGTGRSLIRSNALAGEYTITFSPVPYYTTPAPETKTLTANSKITFNGNYTFADVNNNRMPDAWEQEQFGEVSSTRTSATDTDSDGLTDLGEFVSGTTATDANSKLQVTTVTMLPSNRVSVSWPAANGKVYQLFGSTDGRTWEPYSQPTTATGAQVTHTLTAPAGNSCLFRIQALP